MNWGNSISHYPFIEFLGYFVLIYPLMMAMVWTIFGFLYWSKYERSPIKTVDNIDWPAITVLVPCHNEEYSIKETCESLNSLDYPNYRVYFIDDSSTDETLNILENCINKFSHLYLLSLKENKGKANALNSALTLIQNIDFTVIMDADTVLSKSTLKELILPMLSTPNLDAVTGNPIVYNRNHLLGKIQTFEFSSIIGLIKRSNQLMGGLFTISGCLTAFRTEALFDVHGFSHRTATEDIDITWRLQKKNYHIGFAPKAVAFIQAPVTLKDLWKQRSRWALGGWHLLREHRNVLTKWQWRNLWIFYIDFLVSYIWAILFTLYLLFGLITLPFIDPFPIYYLTEFIAHSSVLILISLIQFFISLKINYQYDPKIWKYYFWVPWYPLFYFIIGALAVSRTSIKGIFKSLEDVGKWKVPVRTRSIYKDIDTSDK